jgi:hypothetical protein
MTITHPDVKTLMVVESLPRDFYDVCGWGQRGLISILI